MTQHNNSEFLPETYHWLSQLHETSPDHLYILSNGTATKIGKSKNPKRIAQKLQASVVVLAVIKRKGFLAPTLNRHLSNTKSGWFEQPDRIAKFLALTKDWHLA